MNGSSSGVGRKAGRLAVAIAGGILVVVAVIAFARSSSRKVYAAPIPPPEGYPKLSLSTKTVTPTLAQLNTPSTLYYKIEIRNTGAYQADNVMLTDVIPPGVTYNGDATASATAQPTYDPGTRTLSWQGPVGFDSTVVVSYSVDVTSTVERMISNTAVISQALIAEPVTVTAETLMTDEPKFTIEKSSMPPKPGAGKPLTYTLSVTNIGQPANNLPITVVDKIPSKTTFKAVGPDGSVNAPKNTVTWNRNVTLDTGETSVFTFSVNVNNDVISSTVIDNDTYNVSGQNLPTTAGEPYTVTVIDPIFLISKQVDPFPPGSNREMTYTLSVFNKGSLATGLVITDVVPANVTYESGGTESGGVVSWDLPSLDSGESAQFTYTVSIGDIADITIFNNDYGVCSAEGVCEQGDALANLIRGPTFEADVFLDPVAKKPGGGTGPVTPTIVLKNLGPGSALDASALMYFRRISVSFNDLLAIPDKGQFSYGPECGDKCVSYRWRGDLGYNQVVTLTTIEGQSSVGGEEGTHYTATVVITDTLGMTTTEPFTGTAVGTITHFANLIPTKSAPPVVGAGQSMTYTIRVYNSGLSTDVPPYPTLTETIPLSTTFVSASDGGVSSQVGDQSVISWTLPAMSPGDEVFRSFAVLVDSGLISGTKIVNDDYRTSWYDIDAKGVLSNTGEPITTVVKEVGLIDSFKTVTPTSVLPGEGNILTYTVHVVNSGPSNLSGVKVHDLLPWQNSTYQRDAVASAGRIISDIVSIDWTGSVAPYSSQLITFTVLVDKDFQGPLTNTATIKHSSLLEDVVAEAVAYVTDKPVLQITKSATPDPVKTGGELLYTIKVENLGQQATDLVVTDTIPANTKYVLGSASASGELVGDYLEWRIPVLDPGEVRYLAFHVTVGGGNTVTNEKYGMTCAEGVSDSGPPLITQVVTNRKKAYLPLIFR
jgi:uncharacterized repeat protein (TIGR01451 family)